MSKSRFPGGLITSAPIAPTNTSANGVFDGREQFQYSATSSGIPQWPGEDYEISRSLRFRGSASAYLSRTFGTATNTKIWTWSGWVKRSGFDSLGARPIMAYGVNGQSYQDITFNSSDKLRMYHVISNVEQFYITTDAVFRDTSAWYHIVATYDSTQANSSNRLALYVNGVKQSCGTPLYPSLNLVGYFNTGVSHAIGYNSAGPYYADGYMAEVNFVDGQALDPSYFGYTDQSTNIWMPKAYSGVYGNNGFYLPFNDPTSTTTIGYDRQLGLTDSSKNNWTSSGISVTAGVTYDSMVDVPVNAFTSATDIGGVVRGNYATFNPNDVSSGSSVQTITQAALTLFSSSATRVDGASSSIAVKTGKWYVEMTLTTRTNDYPTAGWMSTGQASNGSGWYYIAGSADATKGAGLDPYGRFNCNGTTIGPAGGYFSMTWAQGDIIQCAVDIDNKLIWWGKAGTWSGGGSGLSNGNPSAGTGGSSFASQGGTEFKFQGTIGDNAKGDVNFGQRPFTYAPPTGFKSLNTTNIQAIGTTTVGLAGLQANKHFEATVYTGIDKRQSINNAGGFQPDFIWAKSLTNAYAHNLIDSVRGRQGILQSQSTTAELTSPALNDLVSFDSNGFTIGPSNQVSSISNGGKTVAWQWKGGGAAVSNTNGSITSQVSANAAAGFSVVGYTGTGANATVGHGLGVAPSMVIIKSRGAADWYIGHTSVGWSNTGYLILNNTGAAGQYGAVSVWQATAPSSSVITLGTASGVNTGSGGHIAYCWAAVPGYSAFGSYTGNGSTDGPFAYCGFRPRWIMLKRSSTASATYGWQLYDTSRSPYNMSSFSGLWADTSAAEAASTYSIDLLSNGFKLKDSNVNMNASSDTYIYAAFAETPFALNNRAR